MCPTWLVDPSQNQGVCVTGRLSNYYCSFCRSSLPSLSLSLSLSRPLTSLQPPARRSNTRDLCCFQGAREESLHLLRRFYKASPFDRPIACIPVSEKHTRAHTNTSNSSLPLTEPFLFSDKGCSCLVPASLVKPGRNLGSDRKVTTKEIIFITIQPLIYKT